MFLRSFHTGHYRNPLNKYIRHYEGLSYDTELVHSKHQRAKRALSHEDKYLHLDFHAHGRFVHFFFPRYYPKIKSVCICFSFFFSLSLHVSLFICLFIRLQTPSRVLVLFMIKVGGLLCWGICNFIESCFTKSKTYAGASC